MPIPGWLNTEDNEVCTSYLTSIILTCFKMSLLINGAFMNPVDCSKLPALASQILYQAFTCATEVPEVITCHVVHHCNVGMMDFV